MKLPDGTCWAPDGHQHDTLQRLGGRQQRM
jgi:hypothetical protein